MCLTSGGGQASLGVLQAVVADLLTGERDIDDVDGDQTLPRQLAL
jgi:hypothetical protein